MNRGLILLIFVLASLPSYSQQYELVWSEEFNYSGLPDTSKWGYQLCRGCGNNEAQYYTENRLENARVEDSILIIEARKESMGGYQYTSARLVTENKAAWKYGRIELKAKVPGGRGTWPAIWMLPSDWAYGEWPSSGEIDIMEYVGYDPGIIHGTVHTEAYNHQKNTQKGESISVAYPETFFHRYAIEWTPEKIDFFVDDKLYFTFKNEHKTYKEWPFDQPFYLILNIAIGGNWGGLEGIEDSIFPVQMEVDYIRVYKNIENEKIAGPSLVYPNQADVAFSLPFQSDSLFFWEVPNDCEINDGHETNSISVNWGCNEGSVSCSYIVSSDTFHYVHEVKIKPYEINGPVFVKENEQEVIFTLPNLHHSVYEWIIPGQAAISENNAIDDAENRTAIHNDSLYLNWTYENAEIKAIIENSCGEDTIAYYTKIYGQYPYPEPDEPHDIPGEIKAVDYDYGGEGVAYHDITASNTGNGPRKNEGVDTEKNNEGTNVGWIEADEWLEYSIKVNKTGFYSVEAHVASDRYDGGGPFHLVINGEERTSFDPKSTGSWFNYTSITNEFFYLSTNDSLLRIDMGTGGFNLSKLVFEFDTLASSTGIDDATVNPEDNLFYSNPGKINPYSAAFLPYSDMENPKPAVLYPNPAGPYLVIHLPAFPAQVTIFNELGKIYYTGLQKSGRNKIETSKLNHGMYFVRIDYENGETTLLKLLKL